VKYKIQYAGMSPLKNISSKNKDKVITLFAWNEWSEGATLETSIEHGNEFINQLGGSNNIA
tara:strand:+ start:3409 stop:3591 length:183 start_codon:yes stop_codon:yes gene_type:complete